MATPRSLLATTEAGDVVDLLADREAATLEAWLTAHPGAPFTEPPPGDSR